MSDLIAEIRERADGSDTAKHYGVPFLLAELDRVTRERDEARADVEAFQEDYAADYGHASAARERLRALASEMLSKFVHEGHPGRACLRTSWITVEQVEKWRAALSGTQVDGPKLAFESSDVKQTAEDFNSGVSGGTAQDDAQTEPK